MAGGFIKSIIRGTISGSNSSGKGKSKFDANSRPQPELFDEENAAIRKKKLEIRELRREATRMSSKANKRIARLESNNLKSTPAYQAYIAEGKGKFGVKGKTYNEVQSELARLRRFINSETSTVRGASSVLKEMAANTGIKYKNLKELKAKSARFFELSSKVEQYLRTVEDMASAIGYQKIWEAVNQYVKDSNINLDQGGDNLDGMVEAITGALKEYEEPAPLWGGIGWYSLKKTNVSKNGPVNK